MNSPLILCIDLPELLKPRQATLESYGCKVKMALTCDAALKLLEESAFDAVVLDYDLQGMDAEAIAVKIKQQFPNVPIILLSAFYEMPESILWLVDAALGPQPKRDFPLFFGLGLASFSRSEDVPWM